MTSTVTLHGPSLNVSESIGAAEIAAGAVDTSELAGSAVTGAKLASTPFHTLKAAGVAAAGPITLTGAAVGERVVMVFGAPTAGGALVEAKASFESTITVINQIQQSSASNLSANTYVFVLIAASA